MGSGTRAQYDAGTNLADRYRLVRRIAVGAVGDVWEGTDEVLDRKVAVKLLDPSRTDDPLVVARFRRDGTAAARLRHEGIVPIYDTVSEPGIEAVVMELISGRTLEAVVDERGPLGVGPTVRIVSAVAAALEAAHAADVLHRDVSPKNVLLDSNARVMLAGFASGRADDPEPTGDARRSPYLAPEQLDGRPVDARTDVYGLGVMVRLCITGAATPPAGSTNRSVLARLRPGQSPLPRAIGDVVNRATAADPVDRYESVQAFGDALTAAAIAPDQPGDGLLDVLRRPRALAGIVAALVVVGLLLGVTLTRGSGGGDRAETAAPTAEPTEPPAPSESEPATEATAEAADEELVLATRLDLVGAAAFDPLGDGSENDNAAGLVTDGDPTTSWRTERYESRLFGNLKPGVGIYVVLAEPSTMRRVVVESQSTDWAAEVYVAPEPGGSLEEWGDPMAAGSALSGTAEFDVGDSAGAAVLIWITDLGTDRVEISQVVVED